MWKIALTFFVSLFPFIEKCAFKPSLRTASMWSVAGQILDPVARKIHAVLLPWQMDPAFQEISDKYFDRSKYRYVWEWGRAAQDLAGENEELRRVLTAITYRELKAMGGNLDEAFVSFHSLDETNTALYLRQHPNSIFPEGYENKANTLFLVPLREMLEKYKPSEISGQFSALRETFSHKLSEAEAMDLHSGIQELFWQELNFHFDDHSEQQSPILFSDYSRGKEQILTKLLKRFGLTETAGNILEKYFQIFRASYHSEDKGRYLDASDPQVLYPILGPKDVVEASNLDPQLLKKDPHYPMKVLFSLMIYYAHKLSLPDVSRPQIDHAIAQILGEKIHFAISTYSSELSENLKQLGSQALDFQGQVDPSTHLSPIRKDLESTADWIFEIYRRPIHIHIFTADQVITLMKKNPQVFTKAWGSLYPGSWQGYWSLRSLDQF